MTSVDLSRKLVRRLLLGNSVQSILEICEEEKIFTTWCAGETFWQEKLNFDYPYYIGLLYEDSYKSTILMLEYGQLIPITFGDQKYGELLINSYSPINDILHPGKGMIVRALIGTKDIFVNYETGSDHTIILYQLGDWKVEVGLYDNLYSIITPSGNNLFFDLQSIDLSVISPIIKQNEEL